MILVFLGPPGSGKGTQASILSQSLGIEKISAGDVIRDLMKQETEFATNIKAIVNAGKLLADEVVSQIVLTKLTEADLNKGVILDGYPRTIGQAEALAEFLKKNNAKLNAVIDLVVEDDIIVKRITGRFTCGKCGAIYNKYFNNTKVQGKCDVCSSTDFVTRHDDSEEIIKVRLMNYRTQTKPLVDYYSERSLLKQFKGDLPIEELASEIEANV